MPIYEYRCPNCEEVWELLRKMSAMDEPYECPDCGVECDHVISDCMWTQKFRWMPSKDGWIREDQLP